MKARITCTIIMSYDLALFILSVAPFPCLRARFLSEKNRGSRIKRGRSSRAKFLAQRSVLRKAHGAIRIGAGARAKASKEKEKRKREAQERGRKRKDGKCSVRAARHSIRPTHATQPATGSITFASKTSHISTGGACARAHCTLRASRSARECIRMRHAVISRLRGFAGYTSASPETNGERRRKTPVGFAK